MCDANALPFFPLWAVVPTLLDGSPPSAGGNSSIHPGWPHSVSWISCYQIPYGEIPSVCSPSTMLMTIRGTALPQELIPVRDKAEKKKKKKKMLLILLLFQSCHCTEPHTTKTKGILHDKNEKYPNLSKGKSQAPIKLSRSRISSILFQYSVFVPNKQKI